MLKPDSLNSLFSPLEEMMLIQRKNGEFQPPAWLSRSEMLTIYGYVASVICLLIAAWIQRTWPSPIHSFSLELACLAMVIFGIAYMLIAILSVGTLFWRHRKKRLAAHLARLKLDMLSDRSFLMQLLKYDKATLEYGQMQHKHTRVKFDTRISLIIGDLRKLGLFPALTASSMAASTLLKNDSNIYLWMPLILASCFYLVGCYAQGRQERCLQVIDLLDYAIRHADTNCDSAPASRKVTKSR